MSKAIVLLSGGQDSTTCLYWAKTKFEEVSAIGFFYGQKHSVEIECAKKIAQKAGVDYKVFDLSGIFQRSALVDTSLSTSGTHPDCDLPATFTAGRNAVFLSIAGGYAHGIGANHLVTGVCETDFSGYPDCRLAFIESQQETLRLALDLPNLWIHTPLMFLTKAETWRMAHELDIMSIIVHDTHTDYNGTRDRLNPWGYGNLDNPATKLRAKGFFEARKNGWI